MQVPGHWSTTVRTTWEVQLLQSGFADAITQFGQGPLDRCPSSLAKCLENPLPGLS